MMSPGSCILSLVKASPSGFLDVLRRLSQKDRADVDRKMRQLEDRLQDQFAKDSGVREQGRRDFLGALGLGAAGIGTAIGGKLLPGGKVIGDAPAPPAAGAKAGEAAPAAVKPKRQERFTNPFWADSGADGKWDAAPTMGTYAQAAKHDPYLREKINNFTKTIHEVGERPDRGGMARLLNEARNLQLAGHMEDGKIDLRIIDEALADMNVEADSEGNLPNGYDMDEFAGFDEMSRLSYKGALNKDPENIWIRYQDPEYDEEIDFSNPRVTDTNRLQSLREDVETGVERSMEFRRKLYQRLLTVKEGIAKRKAVEDVIGKDGEPDELDVLDDEFEEEFKHLYPN